ncbi:monocyte chemotactic protein 1B-like [Engraulis encrasicolus]|uniref:monocyte chemotactic protein 1B-like n=1 Tax=Engraulis encrasicolus TaxID=184585 RepID=UPI002FD3409F
MTEMASLLRTLCFCMASVLLCATLGRAVPTNCCLTTVKIVLPPKNIRDYHWQKVPLCPIEAVVLTTVKGVQVCSDPKKPWVKKAVKHVDSLKRPQVSAVTTQAPLTNATESARNATSLAQA